MPEIPENIKKIAEDCGAILVPYPRLDSHFIFIDKRNRKRVTDIELEEMEPEQFRLLLQRLANPPKSEIKSTDMVEWFRKKRLSRKSLTGHF